MKRSNLIFIFLSSFILWACHMSTPKNFEHIPIQTSTFKLAVWKKDTDLTAPVKIYIEGDGYAFTHHGYPSQNPTPKGKLVRELAFKDPSPNVIYMARPCQYLKDGACQKKYWTTARFSKEVIRSIAEGIKVIAKGRSVILIGYSGGAQVAGLCAVMYPELNVIQLVTIAGNLDHENWTKENGLIPLDDSLSLTDWRDIYAKIPQIHYVAEEDIVVSPTLTQNFVNDQKTIHSVSKASHGKGFESVYSEIWGIGQEK